jgi:hypothetical protein
MNKLALGQSICRIGGGVINKQIQYPSGFRPDRSDSFYMLK